MGRKKLVKLEDVLRVIRNLILHNGVPPTVEEIRQSLNVGSTRTIKRYLDQLEETGAILRWPGARGIRLRRTPEEGILTIPVPLVGNVTAGVLSITEEYIEGWIRLPETFIKPKSATFFLLRVSGDSMDKAQVDGGTIEDGDLVLVRQQPLAKPGEIIVALVDGETTIKRLKQGSGYYILQPESTNPKHQLIIVEADFQVQGIVVRVLKKGSNLLQEISGQESTD